MGQSEPQAADDTRSRLMQTARAMVLKGDNNFTIATLCGEAQVDRDQFRAYFSGKTALMAALMHEKAAHAAPALSVRDESLAEPQPEHQPEPEPQPRPQREIQTPKAEQEPSVPAPDAWLERRLRVFERALTALETRAETTAREQARAMAQLEEKLAAVSAEPGERRLMSQPVVPQSVKSAKPDEKPVALGGEAVEQRLIPLPSVLEPLNDAHGEEKTPALGGDPAIRLLASRPVPRVPAPAQMSLPVRAAHWSDAAPVEQSETPDDTRAPEAEAVEQEDAEVLAFKPAPVAAFSKEEMADVLESARARVRAAAAVSNHEEQPKDANLRARWIAIGALSLVALFLCIGLVLGNTAGATRKDRVADWHGDGASRSHVAQGALAQTIASADSGDARAEARLALAYLRGQGVARDASAALRWSHAAAEAGEPAAQYLLGALYQQGEAVKADPARAFAWFQAAAAKGNLKAMHNLAIAYAEGLGTAKNETRAVEWFTRAAERGYVDSAFDLAVMYERGSGVPQDLTQALKWYGIAAHAGDQPSRARVDFLRGQMNAADAKRAMDQVAAFAPLPALPEANAL